MSNKAVNYASTKAQERIFQIKLMELKGKARQVHQLSAEAEAFARELNGNADIDSLLTCLKLSEFILLKLINRCAKLLNEPAYDRAPQHLDDDEIPDFLRRLR